MMMEQFCILMVVTVTCVYICDRISYWYPLRDERGLIKADEICIRSVV